MFRLIGVTKIIKSEYLAAVKDSAGIRACDSGLDIPSDEAYVLATLTRTCKLSMAYKSGLTDLIQIVAIADDPADSIIHLIGMGRLKVVPVDGTNTIIYGQLTNWIRLTIDLLSTTTKDYIILGNYLYLLISQAGFVSCFEDYTKIPYDKSLFTLRQRHV